MTLLSQLAAPLAIVSTGIVYRTDAFRELVQRSVLARVIRLNYDAALVTASRRPWTEGCPAGLNTNTATTTPPPSAAKPRRRRQ